MENRTGMVIQINRDSLRKIIKLQAENKVLKKYVTHPKDCGRWTLQPDTGYEYEEYLKCTCGLDDILDDSN